MKVTCKVIQDLLPLYHDSVCSPETAALVEEHLKDCEACQEVFHRLQDASSLPLPVSGKEERKAEGLAKVKKALRKKRHDAHVALDSLWKNGIMSRKEAYRLLQLSMGLPAEDAHIAKFSAARCDEVIALSRRFRAAAARAA